LLGETGKGQSAEEKQGLVSGGADDEYALDQTWLGIRTRQKRSRHETRHGQAEKRAQQALAVPENEQTAERKERGQTKAPVLRQELAEKLHETVLTSTRRPSPNTSASSDAERSGKNRTTEKTTPAP
jgi:hypothetical protein